MSGQTPKDFGKFINDLPQEEIDKLNQKQLEENVAQKLKIDGEIRVGDLAHRPIELEFLDRAQHEHLLAFERFARPLGQAL